MTRLAPQAAERIDRSQPVAFTFDGRGVTGVRGDTIGSALYASGTRTFSRSFKYHRRRGLLCCAGQCPNCLVAVDGAPGVRACTEPIREGMTVEHMNAWPSLEHDAMAVTDVLGGPFTPPGFYYKTFIRPRRAWPLYERVLRRAAGLGRLPRTQAERGWQTEYRRRHADVLVVGGGLAGLSAAIAAAELGADVVLAEEGPALGGRLLWEGGHQLAAELEARALAAGVELIRSGPALGHFDGLVPVWQGSVLHQVRARAHVYATGAIEQPLLFGGNDLPGVMLTGGARRLVALYGVAPGTRAVVAGVSDRALEAAIALHDVGLEVLAVSDARTGSSLLSPQLAERGIELLSGWMPVGARGRRALSEVTLAPVGGHEMQRRLGCDLLLLDGGSAPATALVTQAGASTAYDGARGHFRVEALPDGVFACGELAGLGVQTAARASGERAGQEAARTLGLSVPSVSADAVQAAPAQAEEPPAAAPAQSKGGRAFACLCEDVTVKDIERGVAEGYDSIELCKRFTTVTMGPCQGRMCQLASIRLMSEATGQPLELVGTTTARPPWSTVPLGALAGRPIEPAKRSSIHGVHRELGANVKWAGDWRRPYDYGDPEGEALSVHEGAGLIDVSTLGKLLVRGSDAGELLDRLYPNRLSNLAPGRVRYGVLTSDAGRIMDDGTITRVDAETFYVTTTSSGAGAVEQWFAWWLADWDLEVRLSDVTQALSAVNLAGPRAREILATLTDLDCSAEGFAYLDAKQAPVAGVDCLLMRIGFVGELGYEVHFPAAMGEDVWRAIIAAGESAGIRPFGLEPQRILRLQKQHIIVGQDTDSESTPFGASMPWAVKLDKEQAFIGRWALERQATTAAALTLVGFTLERDRAPTEGAVVLDANSDAAGQVTSARRSRQLERVIGMAWVPRELAQDGARIVIADGEQRLAATVATQPFFDPEGSVLRS